MTEPEPIAGYNRDGDPYYADRALDDRLKATIEGLDYDEREELAGAAFWLSGELRRLWPEWRDIVERMVERNERRARELAEHEAAVLAELESGGDR